MGQSLAATFNRALARAYGEVVGSEARGEGFNEWLGPAVDIDRTPLAGRQPEAEGEDPFLAGNTSAPVILGAQSQHVISTLSTTPPTTRTSVASALMGLALRR